MRVGGADLRTTCASGADFPPFGPILLPFLALSGPAGGVAT
jgi:hypothetical protein